jgi:hypothetical protein
MAVARNPRAPITIPIMLPVLRPLSPFPLLELLLLPLESADEEGSAEVLELLFDKEEV